MLLRPPRSTLFPYTMLFRSTFKIIAAMLLFPLTWLALAAVLYFFAGRWWTLAALEEVEHGDRKSTRLNSSHTVISYAVFWLKKKKVREEGTVQSNACTHGSG